MKRLFVTTIVLIFFTLPSFSQEVEVIKYDQLEKIIQSPSKSVKVINFWATWCAPCVKELPAFEKLSDKFGNKVDVILVSMDFPNQLETKLKPFIKRKGIQSTVKLLNETDFNAFIDKVDRRWSGAIPATLILDDSSDKRMFIEKSLKEEELFNYIEQYL